MPWIPTQQIRIPGTPYKTDGRGANGMVQAERCWRESAVVGVGFTAAVFVTYFLLGLGLLGAIKTFSVSRGISTGPAMAVGRGFASPESLKPDAADVVTVRTRPDEVLLFTRE